MGNSNTSKQTNQVDSGWSSIKQNKKYQKLRPAQKKMAKRLYITLIGLGITVTLAITMVLLWMRYYSTSNELDDSDYFAIRDGYAVLKKTSTDAEYPDIDQQWKKDHPRMYFLNAKEKEWVRAGRRRYHKSISHEQFVINDPQQSEYTAMDFHSMSEKERNQWINS
jgi:hypothetical protein